MQKIPNIKHLIIAAGVIASVAFYIIRQENDSSYLLRFDEPYIGQSNAEGLYTGLVGSGETADEWSAGADTGPSETFSNEQKEELSSIVESAVYEVLENGIKNTLREEIMLAGEEGYLEKALAQAESIAESEAERKRDMVNINTADVAELTTLDGIGEKRAADIISYREAHGGFNSIDELMNVSGIKNAVFDKIKDKIYV